MRNGYKISLLVIAILLAFSMTVGTSYAFWSTTVTQTDTNKVITGCLKIEINDTVLDEEGTAVSTNINLLNTYPMSDSKGLTTKPYTLTIKNVCTLNAEYKILLNSLSDSSLSEDKIKYHFVKTSPVQTTMNPTLINTISPIPLDYELANEIGSSVNGTVKNTYILETGVLNAQTENVTDSVTYNLRLWIDEKAGNEIMGQTYESAIAVYAEAVN